MMGITSTFDNASEEILKPAYVAPEVDGFPEIVIVTFKKKIIDIAVEMYGDTVISETYAGGIPIYKLDYNGKSIGIYLTRIGGPASVVLLEEIIAKGAKKIVFLEHAEHLTRTWLQDTSSCRQRHTGMRGQAITMRRQVTTLRLKQPIGFLK